MFTLLYMCPRAHTNTYSIYIYMYVLEFHPSTEQNVVPWIQASWFEAELRGPSIVMPGIAWEEANGLL